jgi:hypothetical protein
MEISGAMVVLATCQVSLLVQEVGLERHFHQKTAQGYFVGY